MAKISEFAPIALFAYKRPDHLRATIASLLRNPEASRSRLFVFSDGAKSEADISKVAAVREYLAWVTGFAAIEIIASPHNKGLSASIVDGVSLVLRESDRVIVLEDDLVVSQHFLAYMNAGLNCYADDEEVASIHGYLYPLDRPMPETFFLRGADCWGWATWRRAWAHFNPDGAALLGQLEAQKLTYAFDHEGTAPFTKMLVDQIQGRNDSWAVRWHASCFLAKMFTLYPGHSLVHNIGNDGSGTHSAKDKEGVFTVSLDTLPVSVERIAVLETPRARDALAAYFRRQGRSGLYRTLRRLAGKFLRTIPWLRHRLGLSADYRIVTLAVARRSRSDGWLRPRVVAKQEAAYRKLLDDMHRGSPRIDLAVAAEAVDLAGLAHPTLLEIGCGSGYYSEILKTLAQCAVSYTGMDYSPAMIARAKKRYPGANFDVGDATSLQYGDASFDIAFNGVSLMHILEYEKAIAETARTARQAAIFHSVPVFADHPTTQLHKYAYGGPMVESVFNRGELLDLFERYNLKLVKSWRTIDYDVSAVTGAASYAETFLCRKEAKN